MKTKCLLLLAALGLQTVVHAGNLIAPYELENARVLPSGVRNPRYKQVAIALENKYNVSGAKAGLGVNLNKQLSWNDLIAAQPQGMPQNLIKGTVQALGFDPAGSPGQTTGEVKTFVNVSVPIFAMGITPRLTLAVAVPVYNIDVQATTGFVKTQEGQQFVDAVCSKNPVKCNEAAMKMNNAVSGKLAAMGYEPIQSHHVSNVGDIKLVGKYLLWNSTNDAIALKPMVTLPTGIAPNANKALDVPTGDGQVDLGLKAIWDHQFLSRLSTSVNVVYNLQVSDEMEMRIPTTAGSALSADKEKVSRDLGDQMSVGAYQVIGKPNRGFSGALGVDYQYMMPSTFQGSAYANERYRLLESHHGQQELLSTTASLSFATIDWYKEKSFVLPLQAQVMVSVPLAGRGSVADTVFAGELILFF